jgi:hypothetical protein
MVEKVGEVLRPGDESFVSDLTELKLAEPVDAIAVFHWIPDHDALAGHRLRGTVVLRRRRGNRAAPARLRIHRCDRLAAALGGRPARPA